VKQFVWGARQRLQEEWPEERGDIPFLPTMRPWTNVRTLSANGDGGTDDTAALRHATDSHATHFFPSEMYPAVPTHRIAALAAIKKGHGGEDDCEDRRQNDAAYQRPTTAKIQGLIFSRSFLSRVSTIPLNWRDASDDSGIVLLEYNCYWGPLRRSLAYWYCVIGSDQFAS
jgi:hypothetical protein